MRERAGGWRARQREGQGQQLRRRALSQQIDRSIDRSRARFERTTHPLVVREAVARDRGGTILQQLVLAGEERALLVHELGGLAVELEVSDAHALLPRQLHDAHAQRAGPGVPQPLHAGARVAQNCDAPHGAIPHTPLHARQLRRRRLAPERALHGIGIREEALAAEPPGHPAAGHACGVGHGAHLAPLQVPAQPVQQRTQVPRTLAHRALVAAAPRRCRCRRCRLLLLIRRRTLRARRPATSIALRPAAAPPFAAAVLQLLLAPLPRP